MEKNLGNLENEILLVNNVPYLAIKLLGKGKGGYSYLASKVYSDFPTADHTNENVCALPATNSIAKEEKNELVVLKQIHHEPCDYYTFGNKIEAEKHDYTRLVAAGICIPRLIDIDEQNERIVKEYIDGKTVAEMVAEGTLPPQILEQGKKMATLAMSAGLNIDYYPTNFVADKSGTLYYVDYECNTYMDEWSFDTWGKKYWE